MYADNDVRAPCLKKPADVAKATLMKEFSCLRPDLVHCPIEIFHPVLLVLEHPIVDVYKLFGDVMRFFDGLYHANNRRRTFPKLIQPIRDRRRRGAMPAAGVGRDY
jgi:hypothetical protein